MASGGKICREGDVGWGVGVGSAKAGLGVDRSI